jgi:hypothetical protein
LEEFGILIPLPQAKELDSLISTRVLVLTNIVACFVTKICLVSTSAMEPEPSWDKMNTLSSACSVLLRDLSTSFYRAKPEAQDTTFSFKERRVKANCTQVESLQFLW